MTCCNYQVKLHSHWCEGGKRWHGGPIPWMKIHSFDQPKTFKHILLKDTQCLLPTSFSSAPAQQNKTWNLKCGEDQIETQTCTERAHVTSSQWIRQFTLKATATWQRKPCSRLPQGKKNTKQTQTFVKSNFYFSRPLFTSARSVGGVSTAAARNHTIGFRGFLETQAHGVYIKR